MADNGNIGTGDAAVLALLADTARAGRGCGGGYYGGGWGCEGGSYGGCFGPYANVSTLQHGMDRNYITDLHRDNRNAIQEQSQDMREQFANVSLRDAVNALCASQALGENRISDKLSEHQINTLREQADLSRQIAACCCDTQKGFLEQALKAQECCCDTQKLLLEQQLENQKCCCETQKLVFQENQNTRNMIMDNELRRATDANNVSATVAAINAASAQNTAAIIAAIQNTCGRHGHH